MFEIVKTLIEEPDKRWRIIIAFFKLVITFAITHSIFDIDIKELFNIETFNDFKLGKFLFGTIVFLSLYFGIWKLGEFLLFLILLPNKPSKEKKNKLFTGRDVKEIIKILKLFKINKDFPMPGKNSYLIPFLLGIIDKKNDKQLVHSLLLEGFLVCFITVVFIGLDYDFSFIVWSLFLFILIFTTHLIRTLQSFLYFIQLNLSRINDDFYMMYYRDIVINTLNDDFDCRLNNEENGLCVSIHGEIYQIIDLGIYNTHLVDFYIDEILRRIKNIVPEKSVLITNCNLNEESRSKIHNVGVIKIIESSDEYEILDQLSIFAAQELKKMEMNLSSDLNK